MKFQVGTPVKEVNDPSSMLYSQLRGMFEGAPIVTPSISKSVISLESHINNGETVSSIETAGEQLLSHIQAAYSSTFGTTKGAAKLTSAMESAAIYGGLKSADVSAYLSQPAEVNIKGLATENLQVFGNEGVAGAMSQRVFAAEAFDNKENRNALAYSVTYNLNAARQDEFGEAFFPTVVITPDNVGFFVTVNLVYVYDQIRRSATGAIDNYKRVNVLKARVDPTILRNDQTRVVPVLRTSGANANTTNFVAAVPISTTNDGVVVPTAPLAFNKKFSLLGISQTDAALNVGQYDETDNLDSSVRLSAVYLKVFDGTTTNYIKVPVNKLARSDFNAAVQGNTRTLTLNFETDAAMLTSSTLQVDGTAAGLLTALTTNTIRLSLVVSGSITQDTSTTMLSAGPVMLYSVTDASGLVISSTGGIDTLVSQITAVGYDLIAYRVNSNLRDRGQLTDTQAMTHLYTVPLLPPISHIRPVGASDSMDSQILSALILLTHVRTSNSAVTELFNTVDTLQAFINNADSYTNAPNIFGIASHMVKPTYIADTLDVAASINTISSADKIADVCAVIQNKIRDIGTRLYTESFYKAAADAYFENNAAKPLLIIGVDQQLVRYLTLNGDTRLVGEYFDFKVVSTMDQRMTGKIFIALGVESAINSGVPSPLHFGNMAWKSELALNMPVQRNGANIYQMMVQPSYRHLVNTPILGQLTITNLSTAVTSKTAVNTHVV